MVLAMATEQSSTGPGRSRPALDDPSARAAATSAVEQLVAGLQDGLDRACANAYDRQFASDVLWGSPYGATVSGYEALNAAHHSLMAAGVASASRYQIVQVMSPLPGVAIAQVRRNDLSDDTDNRFSEMAMYVLVERGGHWWLAAGQNTPIAERPAALSRAQAPPKTKAELSEMLTYQWPATSVVENHCSPPGPWGATGMSCPPRLASALTVKRTVAPEFPAGCADRFALVVRSGSASQVFPAASAPLSAAASGNLTYVVGGTNTSVMPSAPAIVIMPRERAKSKTAVAVEDTVRPCVLVEIVVAMRAV
jgi:uncharacterized protein (TIGR02246 family)